MALQNCEGKGDGTTKQNCGEGAGQRPGQSTLRTHSPVFEGHAHAGTAVGQGHGAFPLD